MRVLKDESMKHQKPISWLASAVAAASLVTSSVASAAVAPAPAPTINPLVALSAFGTAQSRAALCSASTVAAAAATAQAQPGCVLPVLDTPPPPVVTEAPPPVIAEPVAVAGAPNLLPLLVGLGAFAALFFLLGRGDKGDGDFFQVISPS